MAKRLGEEERAAIRRSGYLMEQRLVPYIQNRGYYTVPNYSFGESPKKNLKEGCPEQELPGGSVWQMTQEVEQGGQ
jgi:hypothetical protein